MGKTFKVICSWCGKVVGTCQDTDGDSHTVCKKCKAEQIKENDESLKKKK